MAKIVAIDFELANRHFLSACALGIVVLDDGVITFEKGYLIKPPIEHGDFLDEFVMIHHIQAQDVVHAMSFDMLFDKIRHHFDDAIIIAHNAEFDISILRELLMYHDIQLNPVKYACTVELARRTIRGLSNYKLNTVAGFLGVDLDHHQAHSDAKACCQIALYGLAKFRLEDLEELCRLVHVRIKTLGL